MFSNPTELGKSQIPYCEESRSVGLSLPAAATVTSDAGSTVTLVGIVMTLCFYRVASRRGHSLLLLLVCRKRLPICVPVVLFLSCHRSLNVSVGLDAASCAGRGSSGVDILHALRVHRPRCLQRGSISRNISQEKKLNTRYRVGCSSPPPSFVVFDRGLPGLSRK